MYALIESENGRKYFSWGRKGPQTRNNPLVAAQGRDRVASYAGHHLQARNTVSMMLAVGPSLPRRPLPPPPTSIVLKMSQYNRRPCWQRRIFPFRMVIDGEAIISALYGPVADLQSAASKLSPACSVCCQNLQADQSRAIPDGIVLLRAPAARRNKGSAHFPIITVLADGVV